MTGKFGRLLRTYRKDNDLTQRQLREELREQGYDISSNSTVSKWENGINKPDIETVKDLEMILSTKEGILLRAAGYALVEELDEGLGRQLRLKHFEDLADVAKRLLDNGLDNILEDTTGKKLDNYTLAFEGYKEEVLTYNELVGRLQTNIDYMLQKSEYDLGLLETHLEYENRHMRLVGLYGVADRYPLEMIELLKVKSRSRDFKGICSVCKDWQ